jgi:hypothetical protein
MGFNYNIHLNGDEPVSVDAILRGCQTGRLHESERPVEQQ